ncbi:MAG: RecX family transcriptional regulator [Candidatus Nanoarchaeia archaeon]
MNFISYKPRTEQQVRDKLRLLGFSSNEIELCIQFLKEFNYLDDENFTEKYIKDNIKRKALSKKKLTYDLMRKGISRAIIDKFMNLLFKDEDDFENAKKKLDKVKNKLKTMNETEQKKYIYQYLLRQGFKSDTIKEVLKDYLITFK